jgi:5,6,7,8-tetrahydromethanopterin hydro-lyase
MAKINNLRVGESLNGDGNEVAHIDLMIGPRGSAAESAFANCLTNNKDGFSSLLAVVAPKHPDQTIRQIATFLTVPLKLLLL